MLRDSGHRPDGGGLSESLTDEQREHQLPRLEGGLAHQTPDGRGLPQSAQSDVGEAHGASSSAACGRV